MDILMVRDYFITTFSFLPTSITYPDALVLLCYISHYNDVIMTTIASQITSLAVVYSTVYSDADQRKHQSSESLAFVWGIHRDRWIPRTKGQLRGKCFHLMTSSWFRQVAISTLATCIQHLSHMRTNFLCSRDVDYTFGSRTFNIEIFIHIDCLVQDCSISSALAIEIMQSCTKQSRKWCWHIVLRLIMRNPILHRTCPYVWYL